jgi:hypothetical protein
LTAIIADIENGLSSQNQDRHSFGKQNKKGAFKKIKIKHFGIIIVIYRPGGCSGIMGERDLGSLFSGTKNF